MDREPRSGLFVAQSYHWVDAHCAPRGNVARKDRYQNQHDGDAGERQRIACTDSVEHKRQTVGFTHDVLNYVDPVKDANGNSTTYTYDVDGNVVKTTDPLANVTSSTYDASDNKLSETNPLGKTTNYAYDQLGNRLTESDPLSHTTTYTYNAFSKPLTIADPNGHSTTNTYDANGNLLTTTTPTARQPPTPTPAKVSWRRPRMRSATPPALATTAAGT
jgi:YD repeat-containing protein